jgi:hypothetical protein
MKKTELEKLKGSIIQGRQRQAATPERFGQGAAGALDRREQRKLDREQGLVPFAVKLDAELVARLRELAEERQESLNALVGELLEKGLAAKK